MCISHDILNLKDAPLKKKVIKTLISGFCPARAADSELCFVIVLLINSEKRSEELPEKLLLN